MARTAPRTSGRQTPRKHAIRPLTPRKTAQVKGGSLNPYFEEVTGEKQGRGPRK